MEKHINNLSNISGNEEIPTLFEIKLSSERRKKLIILKILKHISIDEIMEKI